MDDRSVGLLLTGLGAAGFGLGSALFWWLMRRRWLRAQRHIAQGGLAQGPVVETYMPAPQSRGPRFFRAV